MMTDRQWGLVLSVGVHTVILGMGTFLWVTPPQYQMRSDPGDVSVDLVGDPGPAVSAVRVPLVHASMVQAKPATDLSPPPATSHPEPMPPSDGASHHSGGATVSAKPIYLENPPPAYPERARRLGQEGVVLLAVTVSPAGIALHIDLKKTSGFPLLDNAAMAAVKRWRFRPATVAGIPVETTVDVPVRFKLQ
jgi:protein TonB